MKTGFLKCTKKSLTLVVVLLLKLSTIAFAQVNYSDLDENTDLDSTPTNETTSESLNPDENLVNPENQGGELQDSTTTVTEDLESETQDTPQAEPDAFTEATGESETENADDTLSNSETAEEEQFQDFYLRYESSHQFLGGITSVSVQKNNTLVFFAGNDGFVSAYNYQDFSCDTWQVSTHKIKAIASHPLLPLLAIYETNELSIHYISLWDWQKKQCLFTKGLENNVVSLSWSARGTYLFVGDTSLDGIQVFDVKGNYRDVFITQPGIVLLAATAESEKSVVTYSETGSLLYTSLKNKNLPVVYNTERQLQRPIVLKNFTLFAGYKNGKVFLLDALSGNVTQTYEAKDPIFASQITDTVPLWLEKTNNQYCIRQGNVKSASFSLSGDSITVAAHAGNLLVVGTKLGFVYILQQQEDKSIVATKLSTPSISPVLSLKAHGKKVYAISQNSIYASDEGSNEFEHVITLPTSIKLANNLTVCDSGIFLWQAEKKGQVYFYSFETKSISPFYKTASVVLDVNVLGNTVVITKKLVGFTALTLASGSVLFEYSVEGIQSAIPVDEALVLVAKNTSDYDTPFTLVNIKTSETLPFAIPGVFAYGLTQDKTFYNEFYCFVISHGETGLDTDLYTIHLDTDRPLDSTFQRLFNLTREELTANVVSQSRTMVTNLGSTALTALQNSNVINLDRSYALFKGMTFSENYLYALNADGTITVYDNSLSLVSVLAFQ